MTSLSVIVPATDDPPWLGRCLAAIEGADDGPEETIAVEQPHRSTPAAARNAGARLATGDVLVFVDADIEIHCDTFSRIRAAFEDADLHALFGSYDDHPLAPGTVSRFRNLLHHYVHQSSPGPATTFWAGLGAVRRETFVASEGFDASRRYLEDVELGMRLVAADRRIVLDPAIQGTHLKRWGIRQMIVTDFGGRAVPWVILMLQKRRITRSLNLSWRHRASAASVVGLAAAGILVQPLAAVALALALLALNGAFYAMLMRRLGPLRGLLGILLHIVHHVVSVVAIPAALVAHSVNTGRRLLAPAAAQVPPLPTTESAE